MATLSFWILRSLCFHENKTTSSSLSLLLLLLLLLFSIIPTVDSFLGFHPTTKSSLLLTKSSSLSPPLPPIIITLQKYNHVRLVVAAAFQDGVNNHDIIIPDNGKNDDNNDNDNNDNNDNKDCNSWDRISPPIATIQSPWVTIICERYRDNSNNNNNNKDNNNNNNALLDYWRVEKDHSIVILTIYQDHLIFPKRQYRPGVDKKTLDFPGGRLTTASERTTTAAAATTSAMLKDEKAITTYTSTAALESSVLKILQKELHLSTNTTTDSTIFERLFPLGSKSTPSTPLPSSPSPQIIGWPINSSFSNQRLYGYVAILKDTITLDNKALHSKRYNIHNQNNDLYQLLDNDLSCLQCRAILMEWMLLQQRQGR